MTKHWQPWTIEDGALRLTEWPDHGSGTVLVDVDVFEELYGPVLNTGHGKLYSAVDGETAVLRDLFRHIDTHPQTHFILRTRHPERLRECWPKNTNCVCPGVSLAPGAECDHHPSCPARGYHRPNVTLQIGPLHTQADADRLIRPGFKCCDLVSAMEWFCQPTEGIDLSVWLFNRCRRCGEVPDGTWEERCACGAYKVMPPLLKDERHPDEWVYRIALSRITVSGGDKPLHPDWVRCLRDQATAAGVEFVFENWGDWMPQSQGCHREDASGEVVWQCVCGKSVYPLTDDVRCECGDIYNEEWERQIRVGREHSGNTIDGRTWPRTEAG